MLVADQGGSRRRELPGFVRVKVVTPTSLGYPLSIGKDTLLKDVYRCCQWNPSNIRDYIGCSPPNKQIWDTHYQFLIKALLSKENGTVTSRYLWNKDKKSKGGGRASRGKIKGAGISCEYFFDIITRRCTSSFQSILQTNCDD